MRVYARRRDATRRDALVRTALKRRSKIIQKWLNYEAACIQYTHLRDQAEHREQSAGQVQ